MRYVSKSTHTHTYCGNMDVPTNITMLWCRFVFIKSGIEQKGRTDQNWSEELRLCLEAIQQADQLLFNLGGQGELHLGGHWTVTSWELIVNMFGSSCEQFIHLDLEVLLIISPWTCEPCDVFINFKSDNIWLRFHSPVLSITLPWFRPPPHPQSPGWRKKKTNCRNLPFLQSCIQLS